MDLQKEAYSGVRSEATQIFNNVRQLTVAEYAALPVLLSALLQAQNYPRLLLFDIVLAGLIAIVTLLGRRWYLQALRQTTYLMVAFELSALRADPGGERCGYWILANRSFSRYLRKQSRRDYHIPSQGLAYFMWQQIAIAVVLFLADLIASFDLFGLGIPKQSMQLISDIGPLVPPLIVITFAIPWAFDAKNVNRNITTAWREYIDDRPNQDQLYLADAGFPPVVQRSAEHSPVS